MNHPRETIRNWYQNDEHKAALFATKVIVVHDSCPDGLASAMILRDVFPRAEVAFAQYGTASLTALKAEPGMVFCDISPPRDRAQEFVAAGAFVLDHHRAARDIVESFGERGAFADEAEHTGWSGARLAIEVARTSWESVLNQYGVYGRIGPGSLSDIVLFAELAGVRDTWQTKDGRWQEACEQAAVLAGLGKEWFLGPHSPHLTETERARSVSCSMRANWKRRSASPRRCPLSRCAMSISSPS